MPHLRPGRPATNKRMVQDERRARGRSQANAKRPSKAGERQVEVVACAQVQHRKAAAESGRHGLRTGQSCPGTEDDPAGTPARAEKRGLG